MGHLTSRNGRDSLPVMKRRPKLKTDLEKALLAAMRTSGLTRYRIALGSGVDYAALSRFVRRKRTLTLPAAGKLASFLGLELKPKGG